MNSEEIAELLDVLRSRFEQNVRRHPGVVWTDVRERLEADAGKLRSLGEMERTGGEPDVVGRDDETDEYLFVDGSPESPEGRRSKISVTGINFYRLEDGKIAQEWEETDSLGMLRQLGMLPT